MAKFTQENVDEMIQQGIITQYILTDHYLAVNDKESDAVSDYLESHGFSSGGETMCYDTVGEFYIVYINH